MFDNLWRSTQTRSVKSRGSRARRGWHRRLRGIECLETRQMMSAVPAYSSLPGADVSVYLDFNGHIEAEWGQQGAPNPEFLWHDVKTPVFSLDDNPDFSPGELQMIERIWQCVAEDFAPFNINVTTVEPAAFGKGAGLRVAIGGSYEDWYVTPASGTSMTGSYSIDGYVNTVYVFSDNLFTARQMADTASQEIGHSFGLDHQSIWNTSDGSVIEEYYAGNAGRGPIMGNSYNSQRSVWWKDTVGENGWGGQDDMGQMTNGINLFGFRTDDHGNTSQTATLINNYHLPVKGVIASNLRNNFVGEDIDYFKVTLPANQLFKHWVASVDVDVYSANLDAKLTVYKLPSGKADGKTPTLVGVADPGDDLGALVNLTGGGTYLISVRSHGEYGDLGQYTLRLFEAGEIIANTNPIFQVPVIDVICDPLRPVVLPGGTIHVGQTVAGAGLLNSELLLANQVGAKTTGGTAGGTGQSPAQGKDSTSSPNRLQALDLAFADLGNGQALGKRAL